METMYLTLKRKNFFRLIFVNVLIILILLLYGCTTSRLILNKAEEAAKRKDWDSAVRYYLEALERKPDSVEYKILLSKAMISASNNHLNNCQRLYNSGNNKLAILECERAIEYNPENNKARRIKIAILKRMEEIRRERLRRSEIEKVKSEADRESHTESQYTLYKGRFNLVFKKADLREIFKAIYKITGVNILYDEGFKSKKVSVDLKDVTIHEALKMILLQTKMFYKVVGDNTIIIIPDTPLKRKEYEELVMRTFFLGNTKPEEIFEIIKRITDVKKIVINKNLKTISLVTTPEKMKIVEKIVKINDKPKAEVMVDIEIIEVNNQRMKEYGIQLDHYSITEMYSPEEESVNGESSQINSSLNMISSIRGHMLSHTDASDYLFLLPRVEYKILKFDRFTKIKANPQILVLDDEKVEVKLGDKVPIPTTTFRPIATGGVNQQPITSFTMQDVGINIKITPHIHHDGWVTLDLKFELSFVSIPGDASIPPTIGNRMVKTKIRLKDGETTVLAGLLRDKETNSQRGFPILSKIPIIKEIFSRNKKEHAQNDIILTITPRIIHFPYINKEDLVSYWVGSEKHMGLKSGIPELKRREKGKIATEKEKKGKEEKIGERGKRATAVVKKNKKKDKKENKESDEEISGETKEKDKINESIDEKIKKAMGEKQERLFTHKVFFIFEDSEKKREITAYLVLGKEEKIKKMNLIVRNNSDRDNFLYVKRCGSLNNKRNQCPMVYRHDNKKREIIVKISCRKEFLVKGGTKLFKFGFKKDKGSKPDLEIFRAEIYNSVGKRRILISDKKKKGEN